MLLQQHSLKNLSLIGSTLMIITLILTQNVNGKPQDPNIFENAAAKGLAMAGGMAEMIGNAGLITKQMGFESPFGKGISHTAIGPGAAFRNDDDDSSEEDDRRRKKRSLNVYHNLLENHLHVHRGKRSPCHGGDGGGGGTGTGGTGTGTGGTGADGDDVDIAERRRRAYARKMAARKKARNKKNTRKTNSRRKYLVDNDADEQPAVTRRKRQSEVEDLNQNMTDASKDFQQQAQQFAEKIRNVFENLMNSMNQMAQKVKQHFTGQQNTTMMNMQEI